MKKFKTLPLALKYYGSLDVNEIHASVIRIRKIKGATVWKYSVGTYLEWVNM